MRYTHKVYERLKREQHIQTLFLSGKRFLFFPLRLIYNIVPRPQGKAAPVLAGFSVPKKRFSSSAHRHRIRRLMVEAWRLNKHTVYAAIPADKQVHLFLVFTGKEIPEYPLVEQTVIKGIRLLAATFPPAPAAESNQPADA